MSKKKTILMVVANPSVSTTTGWPVGFWASELIHPYDAFVRQGYEVAVASPEGGKDAVGLQSRIEDEANRIGARFIAQPAFQPHAVRDGNFITGQQQHSGGEVATLVISALEGGRK